MTMRLCSHKDCKQMKDEKDFYTCYDVYCKECRKNYSRKWIQKRKENKEERPPDEMLISLISELCIINEKLEKIGEAVGMDLANS
jgi:hypothetical protein